jgi:hypothetical protein
MATTLFVQGTNQSVTQERSSWANRVLAYFDDRLPTLDLLVFLDDVDWEQFRTVYGPANRGWFSPTHEFAYYRRIRQAQWPPRMAMQLVKLDPVSYKPSFPNDCAIYLYDSSCRDEPSLTMTLAHELQHFIQYGNDRTTWAFNTVILSLPREVIEPLGIIWPDIPIEREARIVAKRAAQALIGNENAEFHIESRSKEASTSGEVSDWNFIREVDVSREYTDLPGHTRRLYQHRLWRVRPELEDVLSKLKEDPLFPSIDLDTMFGGD